MAAIATMRRGVARTAVLALLAAASLAAADDAAAQEGPRLGEYKLRQGTGEVWTGTIVLKGDGVYELYDMPTRNFRGRGNYRYDAAAARVRWLSGINYEMGRGGTFTVQQGGRIHRITMGVVTYAINGE